MLAQLTIPRKNQENPAFDHGELFKLGLDHVRRLSSRIWTDYNVHDPGITILELLCYGLTDLAYRASFPVQDLLASADKYDGRDPMPTAERVLPNRPLNQRDYRKLLIDLEGVRNAWIEPEPLTYWVDGGTGELAASADQSAGGEPVRIAGLYRVSVDYEPGADREKVRQAVENKLQMNRNLCEDFLPVNDRDLEVQEFNLCCQVELAPAADPSRIEAALRLGVQEYLDPPVPRYTLSQMLERKKPDGTTYLIEEILEGPLLENGFIDDAELDEAQLRREIRLSDLISIIIDLDGVRAVRDLVVTPAAVEKPGPSGKQWVLAVEKGKKPALKIEHLHFYKRNLPVPVKEEELRRAAAELAQKSKAVAAPTGPGTVAVPTGTYRELSGYYSVQNHFPAIYGLNQDGLGGEVDDKRRALALQLKGYFLFFDQVMADYLAQLSRVEELFSLDPTVERTYFHQVVDSFRDFESVYRLRGLLRQIGAGGDVDKGIEEAVALICPVPTDPVVGEVDLLIRRYLDSGLSDHESLARLTQLAIERRLDDRAIDVERRNRFLDHLIARFAERFHDFAHIMYVDFGAGAADMIRHKCAFLASYPETSRDRGLAYNQAPERAEELWDTWNVSGFERRIAGLLGIGNYKRRNLADIAFDLYPELDQTPGDEFRFRICNRDTGQILLSSRTRFKTKEEADAEMRRAIRFGQLRDHYRMGTTKTGKARHYFNLYDDAGKVIARRIEYFAFPYQAEQAIKETVEYLTAHYSGEGMYVIENILLRPQEPGDPFFPICGEAARGPAIDRDPYSYRMHILLPAYGGRFGKMEFRRYAEELIRSETPAHILPKICWLDNDDMSLVEGAYRQWLELKSKRDQSERGQILLKLIYALTHVKNVYPTSKLEGSGAVSEENTFILNNTRLGSSKQQPVPD